MVFFGRTGAEACRFFNLNLDEWQGASLLDCPGGPGSLAALARRSGLEVLALDPLYALDPQADGGLHELDCFDLAWHRRALAELLRVCRRELRIFPAHTITLPTRVHPYVAPLIAELPEGWQASLEPTSYDQGSAGETPMLRIRRVAPTPEPLESSRPLPAQQ